jgi:hypothetical protein
MTKRRRLPYAAGALIDEATMSTTDAIRLLMPLIECKQLSPEERVSLPARAVIKLRMVIDSMSELRDLAREDE